MIRSWVFSAVIAAIVGVLAGVSGIGGGTSVVSACHCVDSIDVAALQQAGVMTAAATPDTTPTADDTPAPVVQAEEDRTAGYVVMVGAVLAFVIGFAVLAVRFRKRSHSLGR